MVRKMVKKPVVLAATTWSNSTLYENIKKGLFPAPVKLDPNGRAVAWFEDEIEAFQKAAVERQAAARPSANATSSERMAAMRKASAEKVA